MTNDFEYVKTYIGKCLDTNAVTVKKVEPITSGSGCDVLDCSFSVDSRPSEGILKIYHEGYDDYSEIGVMRTAGKNVLSAKELNTGDIHIPEVTGYCLEGNTSAILYEKLIASEWNRETRIKTAKVLGGLHNISLGSLSDELKEDITGSKPNRDRIRNGVLNFPVTLDKNSPEWRRTYPELSHDANELKKNKEPFSAMITLVHGDFFSANILSVEDRIYIIDWDLLALGDPMWDLGFLVGADRDLEQVEVEAVIKEYRKHREIDNEILTWHIRCWKTFFKLRELLNTIS
ncbi:MAG: phosphotransferase [Dehalococcoidales bacterium]|nr:phosphotransferase [Dehalococcoidales bacterium]